MKKKQLLFTTLALALGCLTGGSSMMAQAGWESAFSQSQTTSTTWEALSTGSTTGKTLGESGTTKYYYLQESLTFTNTNAGGSGLTIKGTVYLYIPSGLTITCVGADGSGATGGGAGIELAEGNTLYIIGSGDGVHTTVTATGGKAANGVIGNNGYNASLDYDDEILPGSGGNGGNGGGGAGAGIGTRGGNGGAGGVGATANTAVKEGTNKGVDGNAGYAGSAAGNMGELYVDQTFGITVTATGGSAATSGGAGGNRGWNAAQDPYNQYTASGGGGGGGGGFGGAASNIGTGGPGGGGGGGGAAGNSAWAGYGFYRVGAGGGKGGRNADGSSASDGVTSELTNIHNAEITGGLNDSEYTDNGWESGNGMHSGGNGGNLGGASSAGSMNSGQLKYNITYHPIKTRVNGSNTNDVTVQYTPSSATTVILPKNVEGYQWVLSVYGKDCSSNAQITKSVFTQAKKTSYGGNEDDDALRTIVLADVYGNLTFTEVASLCKLNNNKSNDQTIEEFCHDYESDALNYPITVRLKDRTLYKDNHWNTICLPFDLTPTQFSKSPLKGSQVKKLDEQSGYYPNGGTIGATVYTKPTLFFNFVTVETSTETLKAGKPYLVKWTSGSDLVDNTTKGKTSATHDLDFTGVEITSTAPTFWEGNGDYHGAIQFVGTYSPTALTGGDKTTMVLGADDKLYYPSKNMSVNSCRGYFILPSVAVNAQELVMSFDDDEMTTTIQTLNVDKGSKDDNAVYNLNGQRLSAPKKGLNIVNGKKVIIK